MAKLDWTEVNAAKRLEQQGGQRASLAEMPVSGAEVVAGLVSENLRKSMFAFARAVILAEYYKAELPELPSKLCKEAALVRRIARKGGILPFAKWLMDADGVIKLEKLSVKRKQKDLEKPFRHIAAKYELGLVTFEDAIFLAPDHLKSKIKTPDALLRWAHSQPAYADILVHKRRSLAKPTKRHSRQKSP